MGRQISWFWRGRCASFPFTFWVAAWMLLMMQVSCLCCCRCHSHLMLQESQLLPWRRREKKLVSVDCKAFTSGRMKWGEGKKEKMRKHQVDKRNTPCTGAMGTVKQHQWHRSLLRAQANILRVYVHSFVSLPFLFIAVTAVTQQLHWVFGLHSTFLKWYLLSVCIVWIFWMCYKEETVC